MRKEGKHSEVVVLPLIPGLVKLCQVFSIGEEGIF